MCVRVRLCMCTFVCTHPFLFLFIFTLVHDCSGKVETILSCGKINVCSHVCLSLVHIQFLLFLARFCPLCMSLPLRLSLRVLLLRFAHKDIRFLISATFFNASFHSTFFVLVFVISTSFCTHFRWSAIIIERKRWKTKKNFAIPRTFKSIQQRSIKSFSQLIDYIYGSRHRWFNIAKQSRALIHFCLSFSISSRINFFAIDTSFY